MAFARSAGALALAVVAARCGGTTTPAPVTFNKDVAPILFANCASCHRPKGVAPFSLLTYADAVANADEIALATREGHMPPWLPAPTSYPFVGERRLTPAQVQTIQRWVQSDRPEGSPADLPAAPRFTDGWESGQPDVVLTLPRAYELQPNQDDIYRNLVMRTTLPSDVFVRAVEFNTGGAPIHHAVVRVDRTSASRNRDGADGQPGFDGMSWQGALDPDGHFIGWAPGRGPIRTPDGMPWTLPAGADVVVEVHLVPSTKPATIQPTIGLFLTTTPPVHTPVAVRMGSKLIDIPPGKADYQVVDTYELPVDVDLISVYPHAHYLATDMLVTATRPGGPGGPGIEERLMHIPHWDFHWQQDYRFTRPVSLPRGTLLKMTYTFDNSAANAHNPNRPPKRVRTGPRSTDEMAELGLQLLTKSPADAAVIVRAFAEREIEANLALAASRVAEEPNVAEYRALLGSTYVDLGRSAEAIPQLEAALRLKDSSASTRNNLGIALMAEGRIGDALAQFRRAEQIDRRDELIPFNLGNALSRLSRPAEAVAAYRRSLAINPDLVDAHVNLALALFGMGRRDDAFAHYARALELRPDSAVIHANYGGSLAAAGRLQDAMVHTRRALEIDPTYVPAQQNLRRLQQMGVR